MNILFEAITYKHRFGPGPALDIGAIAEGLIFYGRVAIVGNIGVLQYLLSKIPPYILLSLLKDGRIEYHYLETQTGVSTTVMSNGRSQHHLMTFAGQSHAIEKAGRDAFRIAAGNTSQAKLNSIKFCSYLKPFSYADFNQFSITKDLDNDINTFETVSSLLKGIVPNYQLPKDLRFKVERENDRFFVDSNLDYEKLNIEYHKSVPKEHSKLSEAYILSIIQGAYESTYFAAKLDAEVAINPIEKAVQSKTVEAIVNRNFRNKSELDSFIDLVLTDGNAIREAVNSGKVQFSEIVKLLDSADKFRDWLINQPPDTKLISAYYQETIKDSWAEKLPGKSLRWSIFTGIGVGIDLMGAGGVGTAAGVAISGADNFFLDKLLSGWKPHQFIEKELKPIFINTFS